MPPVLFLIVVAVAVGLVAWLAEWPDSSPADDPPTSPSAVRPPLFPELVGKSHQEVIGLVGAPDLMTHDRIGSRWVYPDGELHFQDGTGQVIRVTLFR